MLDSAPIRHQGHRLEVGHEIDGQLARCTFCTGTLTSAAPRSGLFGPRRVPRYNQQALKRPPLPHLRRGRSTRRFCCRRRRSPRGRQNRTHPAGAGAELPGHDPHPQPSPAPRRRTPAAMPVSLPMASSTMRCSAAGPARAPRLRCSRASIARAVIAAASRRSSPPSAAAPPSPSSNAPRRSCASRSSASPAAVTRRAAYPDAAASADAPAPTRARGVGDELARRRAVSATTLTGPTPPTTQPLAPARRSPRASYQGPKSGSSATITRVSPAGSAACGGTFEDGATAAGAPRRRWRRT